MILKIKKLLQQNLKKKVKMSPGRGMLRAKIQALSIPLPGLFCVYSQISDSIVKIRN